MQRLKLDTRLVMWLGAIALVLACIVTDALGTDRDKTARRRTALSCYADNTPQLVNPSAYVTLNGNGKTASVLVTGTADEPCTFTLTATYQTSYPRYSESDTYWTWKTEAVGSYTATQAGYNTALALPLTINKRCYHSDRLKVTVRLETEDGRYNVVTVHNGKIEMPFATPSADGDGAAYGIAAHWSGSHYPSDFGYATIADWSKPELIVCTTQFLFDDSGTTANWDHWVSRLRAYAGSKNKAVIAFDGIDARNAEYASAPFTRRKNDFLNSLIALGGDWANAVTRDVDGEIPPYTENIAGMREWNLFHEAVRDTLAWFYINEWNHSENREPRTGFMFDVWEYHGGLGFGYEPDLDLWHAAVADHDQDGIVMVNDSDEIVAMYEARLDFLRSLRRHAEASSSDSNVGQYFLIGANSVSAISDADMLAELDFVMVECFQCPNRCGTAYWTYGQSGTTIYEPYHNAAAASFVRSWDDDLYYYMPELHGPNGLMPNPDGMSSAFEDLAGYMRDDAGGPWVMPEAQTGSTNCHDPVYLEVFSLLFDHLYPAWVHHTQAWNRVYDYPTRDGYTDIHDLGTATGGVQRVVLENEDIYMVRQYSNGLVEVILPKLDGYDCSGYTYGSDVFEFRIEVGEGVYPRQSAGWYNPFEQMPENGISGVSGNLVNGSTLTISGNGFGVKSPAAPRLFENFDAFDATRDPPDILDQDHDTHGFYTDTAHIENGNDEWRYSEYTQVIGSGLSARLVNPDSLDFGGVDPDHARELRWGVCNLYPGDASLDINYGEVGRIVYDYAHNWPGSDAADICAGSDVQTQWKGERPLSWSANPGGVNCYPELTWGWGDYHPPTYARNLLGFTEHQTDGGLEDGWGAAGQPFVGYEEDTSGDWRQRMVLVDMSSAVDTYDGTVTVWQDGATFTKSNINLGDPAQGSGPIFTGLRLGLQMQGMSECDADGHAPWDNKYWACYDNIYADDSWMAVAIGNASTWATCTELDFQPASSWSNTEIVITLNLSSFEDPDTIYLYVIQADNTPLNADGYPLNW